MRPFPISASATSFFTNQIVCCLSDWGTHYRKKEGSGELSSVASGTDLAMCRITPHLAKKKTSRESTNLLPCATDQPPKDVLGLD